MWGTRGESSNMAVSDFHRSMVEAAASGRTPRFRSTSPSTDDARYVAGNRARQEAERARNASNPGLSGLLNKIIGKNPQARDRSTFRNPSPTQGILGAPGIFSGGSKLSFSDFVPFGGMINYMTRRPVDSGATYTMNTQSGTGAYDPNRVNAMIAASQTPQSANPGSMSRAQASRPFASPTTSVSGFTPEQIETKMLPTYSGLPAGMEAQYSASPAPLLAAPDLELEAFTGQPSADADLELSQWLQTEQGSRYNNPDLPEDFVRRMFEVSKRLKAGKF